MMHSLPRPVRAPMMPAARTIRRARKAEPIVVALPSKRHKSKPMFESAVEAHVAPITLVAAPDSD